MRTGSLLRGVPTTWPCTGMRASTRRGTTSSLASHVSRLARSSGRRKAALAPGLQRQGLRVRGLVRGEQDQHGDAARGRVGADAADGGRHVHSPQAGTEGTTSRVPVRGMSSTTSRPVARLDDVPLAAQRGASSRRLRASRPATSRVRRHGLVRGEGR